jgi:hypothetical protein
LSESNKFSGDFISAINLFRTIGKALKESGGASADFEETVRQLEYFESAISVIQQIDVPPSARSGKISSLVNAIHGQSQALSESLSKLNEKAMKYAPALDSRLDSRGPRQFVSSAWPKIRWATHFSKEISKARPDIEYRVATVKILIQSLQM